MATRKVTPIPGDVTTEPVATAAESARPGTGRVGPHNVAQDGSADWHCPPGVTQIMPGEEVPATTPSVDGARQLETVVDEYGHDVSEHKSSGTKEAQRDASAKSAK